MKETGNTGVSAERGMGMGDVKTDARLFDLVQKFALAALLLIASYHWSEIGKLEQRVFELQRSSVTVDGVRLVEDRLAKQMDAVRLDVRSETQALRTEMNSKLDLIIRLNSEKPK